MISAPTCPHPRGFAPEGHALWDPWLCDASLPGAPRYLLYHLCAPRQASKAERDDLAEIWVAESANLRQWRSLGPALRRGRPGTKHDLAIWTGSTQRLGGELVTFYTARNRLDGRAQYRYDQMEVPHLIQRRGYYFLFFSAAAKDYHPARAAELGCAQTGLHAWVSRRLLGPYEPMGGTGVVAGLGSESGLYGTRVVPDPLLPGEWVALGAHWAPETFEPSGSRRAVRASVDANTLSAPVALRWVSETTVAT